MENTVPKNKPMTKDEWMAWLEKSWSQAQDHTPEQKPVGYVSGFYGGYCVIQPLDPAVVLPVGVALYRAPIECVRMTDEEMDEVVNRLEQEHCAIEAKLKEKNHG